MSKPPVKKDKRYYTQQKKIEQAVSAFIKFQHTLEEAGLSPDRFSRLLENRLHPLNIESFLELLKRKSFVSEIKKQLGKTKSTAQKSAMSFGIDMKLDADFTQWLDDDFFCSPSSFDTKIKYIAIKEIFCQVYPEYSDEIDFRLMQSMLHLFCRKRKIKFRFTRGRLPQNYDATFFFFNPMNQ